MNTSGKSKEATEAIRKKIGNIGQLGGTRHYELTDGKSRGVRAVDVDTGTGFRFTVLPDRAMDISLASFRGTNITYLTPNGEVHPAYYSEYGMEWLRTFFGGLVTTCGLTYFASPGDDHGEQLGLHGRQSTIPARQFNDTTGYVGEEYKISLSGTMADSVLFGDKITLRRTISSSIGSSSLQITDEVENLRSETSPYTVLYHINFGYPLLDTDAEILVASSSVDPYDEVSTAGMDRWNRFDEPVIERTEEDFLHTMAADVDGYTYAALVNRQIDNGLGVYIKFKPDQLPRLTEWKMAGEIDYVLGLEPSNTKVLNRAVLREQGLLPTLGPREKRINEIEIGILDGSDEIETIAQKIKAIGA
jgi:hypothetical protein